MGFPVKVCELLSTLECPVYIERVAVNNVKNVRKAELAIKRAFQNQIEGKGYSFVEVVAACPTNWKMSPVEANKWVQGPMLDYYPLGVYKDKEADR